MEPGILRSSSIKQTINYLLQQHKYGWLGAEALQYLYGLWQRLSEDQSPRPLVMGEAQVFAEFITDDGRRIPLYEGYRNRIKSRWRVAFWSTKALLAMRDRIVLSPGAASLAESLISDRTLPASLEEFADTIAELADHYSQELIASNIVCPLTGRHIIAARLTNKQVDSIAQSYRQNASSRFHKYAYWSGKGITENMTALEVGCGMGYSVTALAGLGVGYSVGVDNAPSDSRWVYERPAVLSRLGLAKDSKLARRVQILPGDVHQIPFDDNTFDLIYSTSVLEHVRDLVGAFVEMARVLKPGGMMIHEADPYFSPKGGHSSCTLDFPWGHARLHPTEFRRYIQEFRPFEYDHTVKMYDSLFNNPRLSLNQIEQAIGRAGLSILSWKESKDINHLPSGDIWRETSLIYPTIGFRDLSTNFLSIVLTKV